MAAKPSVADGPVTGRPDGSGSARREDGGAGRPVSEPAGLAALFARIPAGWSRRHYRGRNYGVTRTIQAGGRIQKVFAEQLGGSDVVSANLYRGDRFRPCEMPAEKVLAFLTDSTPVPDRR